MWDPKSGKDHVQKHTSQGIKNAVLHPVLLEQSAVTNIRWIMIPFLVIQKSHHVYESLISVPNDFGRALKDFVSH